jgi:ribulose-5-phosphate 4-epimerase/fuculose-1-phosphate aldolase
MAEAAALGMRPQKSLKDKVSEVEWQTRIELAAGCRMAYKFGWNVSTRNHFCARVPDAPDHMLINPRCVLWNEITASDFITVDFNGNMLTESDLPPGPAGLNFHSAILENMPAMGASLHVHCEDGLIVSGTRDGLKYVTQESLALYNRVAYHDYEGLADEENEGETIVRQLGNDKTAMIMRNHGLLTVGRSISECFALMDRFVDTCRVQAKLMAADKDFREIPKEVCEHTYDQYQIRWQKRPLGQDEWAAWMRMADRDDPSYRN